MVLEILEALLMLGVPVFLMSWYLFRRLYLRGDLRADSDYGTIKSDLKTLKKNKKPSGDFFHTNWMKFGGGYYGITAAVTLLLIEAGDAIQFLIFFQGFEALFADGIISLVVDVILNQLQNILAAMLWFIHWSNGDRNALIWITISYGAYYLSLRMASRPMELWLDALRSRFGG